MSMQKGLCRWVAAAFAVMTGLGCKQADDWPEPTTPVVFTRLVWEVEGARLGNYVLSFPREEAVSVRWVRGTTEYTRMLEVTGLQMAALENALGRTRFLELPEVLGKPVPDAAVRHIRVHTDAGIKPVTLYFPANIQDPDERSSAARFLRIWLLGRDLLGDQPEVIDDRRWLRKYLSDNE